MGAVRITIFGLLASFLLLLIPLVVSYFFKLKMAKTTLVAVGRMTVQLLLVGVFLEYIFKLNNLWLNLFWLVFMIFTAIFSAVSRVQLKMKEVFSPLVFAFIVSTFLILFYFNAFIIGLDYLFDARYLIALGGMLLGNVLGVNITAINSFFQELRQQNKLYLYRLSLGATKKEALDPFTKHSFRLSLLPMLAKTATMGIVSLPGMMTGQILGGSAPSTAIFYQIAIMVAIYSCGVLSILLTLFFLTRKSFNSYGVLRQNIFKKKKNGVRLGYRKKLLK